MNGPVNDSNVSLKAQLEASTGCVPGGSSRMASWVCCEEMSFLRPNHIRGIPLGIEVLYAFQLTLLTRKKYLMPWSTYRIHKTRINFPDILSKAR